MIQLLLDMKPELKRSEQAMQDLEQKNIFKTDIFEVKPTVPSVQI
jgi:hypothetical protein